MALLKFLRFIRPSLKPTRYTPHHNSNSNVTNNLVPGIIHADRHEQWKRVIDSFFGKDLELALAPKNVSRPDQ